MKHPVSNIFSHLSYRLASLLLVALLGVFLLTYAAPALAAAAANNNGVECTDDVQTDKFKIPLASPGFGMISNIVEDLKCIIGPPGVNARNCNIQNNIWQALYMSITRDPAYKRAIIGVATLYILIYGMLFTFGGVEMSVSDVALRLVKIGVVVTLTTGLAGLVRFRAYVANFFINGGDQLISKMMALTVGGVNTNPSAPFDSIDGVLALITSSRAVATFQALANANAYGFIIMLIIGAAIGSAFRAIAQAVFVYIMALVMLSFLFGLAPIFLIMFLFNRTRYLFDGWLNQIVSTILQPMLLFTFFAFFSELLKYSAYRILRVPVCWAAGKPIPGTPNKPYNWRFSVETSTDQFQFFDGKWGPFGPNVPPGVNPQNIFPVPLVDIVAFFLIASLATQFNQIILRIAREIAGASTNLLMQAGGLMKVIVGNSPNQAAQNEAQRAREMRERFNNSNNVDTPPPATLPTAPRGIESGPSGEVNA